MHSLVDVLREFFESFRGDFCLAQRASWMFLNPLGDTLGVEVMTDVAWEWGHLVVRSKFAHADSTFLVLFKIFLVVFHLNHSVEHLEFLTLLVTRCSHHFFDKCEDAWQAADTNQKQDRHENCWQYCCAQNHQPINEVP